MSNTLNLSSTVTESPASPQTDADGIVCTPAPDEQRVTFWSLHFGSIPQWITLEPTVFAWMDRLCADYSGGIWNFYTLSNGGAFMAPEAESDKLWSLFNPLNGNGGNLSSEAAGLAVCLITYSHHACRTGCDAMTEHYYRLRDYALAHPECNAVMHIID
ncbi:antirestriction protein [Citrobacter braakii]|uniref:antirestriction protein n=1 Tax=Citrobacter braakii TaxID=57706 RepID=UPI0039754760